jgi:hypothetical protein
MPTGGIHAPIRRAVLASFAAVGLVACGDSNAGLPLSPSTSTGGAAPEILRFEAPLVGGGTLDGAALAGRSALIWFWAPT